MAQIDADRLRKRDEKELAALFEDLAPRIRQLALRLSPTVDSDELLAEVFMHLVQDPDRLADLAVAGNVQSWCLHLARNMAVHQLRRARRKPLDEVPRTTPDTQLDPIEAVARSESMNRLWTALETLDDLTRTVVTMRFIDNLPFDIIAQKTGLSPNTIRVKTYRALQQLRKLSRSDNPLETG
jgi:RNA polymerase sigma-70 factor (ECF subfamily)